MSQADVQYNALVERILHEGICDDDEAVRTKWADGTPAYTKSVLSAQLHFNNAESALLTTKYVGWKTAIKEILLFWQQKTNRIKDFHAANVHIWDEWEIKEGKWAGTIGPAYGYQLGRKVMNLDGEKVDQVDYLLHQLKHNPSSRRHVTTLWDIGDLDEMALTPCVWSTQWSVKAGKLNLVVQQRSGDVALGIPYNIIQYQALQMMFAQVLGYEIGTMTFNINDVHIYERHLDTIKSQIANVQHSAPQLKLNPEKTDFYDFNIDDFEVVDYEHGGVVKFEVAI